MRFSLLLAMLLAFTSLTMLPGVARADRCLVPDPKMAVKTVMKKTKIIKSQSSSHMTAGQGSYQPVGGLGGGKMSVEVDPVFANKTLENGETCLYFRGVKVEIKAEPSIQIASNYKKNGCAYNAIMAHEKKHIVTMRRFQSDLARIMRKKMTPYLRQFGGLKNPSPGDIAEYKAMVEARFSNLASQIFSENLHILDRRQNKIDSAAEYAAVSKAVYSCPN